MAVAPNNNVTASTGDQITIDNQTGANLTFSRPSGFTFVSGSGTVATGSTAVLQVGEQQPSYTTFTAATCGASSNVTNNVAWSITVVPGGGGSSSSSSSAPAPTLETLTLAVSSGNTSCTGGSPTGYSGAWLQLPSADACSQTGPNANPNAELLGWATDPIFPVSVAQQIVDLKYGPIDSYFYGMRMIFIPAGGWTFVSGSNNLYPIWSN